ncbi:hypothetical protein FOMPIDRAFT_1056441 [Fomitopsis schrenkii]|uniref:Uncharacterized protein n=1 Tax=Fomitopsis schrenkii TaxID=2126942 RepID=S8DJ96_FOMSC|nr:hypothetical protein FOMPIDRAFT_1056441 [Fomitopsis schrenkii]
MPSSKRFPQSATLVQHIQEIPQPFKAPPVCQSLSPADNRPQIPKVSSQKTSRSGRAQKPLGTEQVSACLQQHPGSQSEAPKPSDQSDEDDEEPPRIVKEVFGEYTNYPDFPYLWDIEEFVVTKLTPDDWQWFQAAVEGRKGLHSWKYYYDKETETLTMAPPLPSHDMLDSATKQGYDEVAQQIPPAPESLRDRYNLEVIRGAGVSICLKDTDKNNKYPDALPGVDYANYIDFLGPVEVGNSQSLHGIGKPNVLDTLKSVGEQQLAVAGSEDMFPQLLGFKMYNVAYGRKASQPKLAVRRAKGKKGKGKSRLIVPTNEDGEEDTDNSQQVSSTVPVPSTAAARGGHASSATSTSTVSAVVTPAARGLSSVSSSSAMPAAAAGACVCYNEEAYNAMLARTSHTVSGRYKTLLQDNSGMASMLLPGCGPWMSGDKELTGGLRVLMFHVHKDDFNLFVTMLAQAKTIAESSHAAAEALWINSHFAIPVLPLDWYTGQLCGLLDQFLLKLDTSYCIILAKIARIWTSTEMINTLLAEGDPEVLEDLMSYVNTLRNVQLNFTPVLKAILRELPVGMRLYARHRAGESTELGVAKTDTALIASTSQLSMAQIRAMTDELRKRKREEHDEGEVRSRQDPSVD